MQVTAARRSSTTGFARYAWITLAYNLAVILWGALVRATGSGAGCGGHWPLCNGQVLPAFRETATVIELTHRVMSGIAFGAVAGLLVWARRVFPHGHQARKWSGWSLVFMITEALVGAALVLLGLVAKDQSVTRVYSLGIHLINTFLLLASLTLAAWYARTPDADAFRPAGWSLAALAALVLVAIAGTITALGDTLFPSASLAEGVRSDFSPAAHFLIRLRVIHPLLAAAAGLLVIFLAAPLLRPAATRLRAIAQAMIFLVLAEIVVGALNIWWMAPVPIQLLHLLIADSLWIALVLFTAEYGSRRTKARVGEYFPAAHAPRPTS